MLRGSRQCPAVGTLLAALARILVVSNMYPPHHYGGYELSCMDVVNRWRERGHEVLVLTSTLRVPGVADPVNERAAGVWRALSIAWEDGDLLDVPLWRRPSQQRSDQRVLAAALAEVRPDVVSIWHMAALSTGLLTTLVGSGVPLVYNVCDDWLTYAARIDPWMKLFVDRPAVGRAVERVTGLPATLPAIATSGAFCFVSDLTAERSRVHTGWTFPVETVVYSGIASDDFPVVDAVPDRPWRWRLLHVGRIDPRKGIETAVRALALLPPEATLEILGRGEEAHAQRLRDVAAELGVADRVHFGVVDRSQLRARYAEADVVLFPTEWEEPFGLVPVEAMASGTPVVATGTGGSGEFLVDGGNCLLFPPGDHTALAAAVTRLATDAELRRALVTGGLATANDLSVDRLADVLEAWHVAAAGGFADGQPEPRRLASAQRE